MIHVLRDVACLLGRFQPGPCNNDPNNDPNDVPVLVKKRPPGVARLHGHTDLPTARVITGAVKAADFSACNPWDWSLGLRCGKPDGGNGAPRTNPTRRGDRQRWAYTLVELEHGQVIRLINTHNRSWLRTRRGNDGYTCLIGRDMSGCRDVTKELIP